MQIGTETNWNEDPNSRDAYMAFGTTYHSQLKERMRIAANGDWTVNTCRR